MPRPRLAICLAGIGSMLALLRTQKPAEAPLQPGWARVFATLRRWVAVIDDRIRHA
jgi:hypothetical protein